MKVSISLPSLYPDLLDAALEHLHPTLEGFDVEILVVSPFEATGPKVRWVPEKVQTGNCAAHALA